MPGELPPPVELLGVLIHPVTRRLVVDKCVEWGAGREQRLLTYVNVHALNLAREDEEFRAILAKSDLTFCDGYGVKWGARMLSLTLPERLTPPDWIPEFLNAASAAEQTVFFLGDDPGVAQAAQAKLELEHGSRWVAGAHHGFFEKTGRENDAVIEMINASGATHLLVGMGMPLQEKWLVANASRLSPRVLLPVGAAFRWIAGVEARAPRWMTDNGLEWAARFAKHPRRHFRRYVVGNARFARRLLLSRFGVERVS